MCRSERRRRGALPAVVVALMLTARPAQAVDAGADLQRARAEFVTATDHVKAARWGEALVAFERSAALRPHALTTFNIGACERALGRYTRARATLMRAIEADNAAGGRELSEVFRSDAKRWLTEIDGIVVRATVKLSPADATLLIDGAPLLKDESGSLTAGLPSSERGVTTPGASFTMVIDPGVHLFALSRVGFANAVVQRRFDPGSAPTVTLDLASLPATIRVSSNLPGAVVSVDDLDTGVAPVEIARPAGLYRVAVRKSGYVPYLASVRVNPGEQPSIRASLVAESTPITKSFWFWAATVAVVGGAATTTYLLTRPDPERASPDGGGLGWVVSVPAAGSR